MNKFIKVKGHNCWFLVVNEETTGVEKLGEDSHEKILRRETQRIFNDEDKRGDLTQRLQMLTDLHISGVDYLGFHRKYKTDVLVRESGSWMTLTESDIVTSVKYSAHYPADEYADIIICENDMNPDPTWYAYLRDQYPNKTISTLSFFDLQPEERIRDIFSKATHITFSTTFTNYEWYKKMVYCTNEDHIITGYCCDDSSWDEALDICPAVDVITEEQLKQFR